MLCYELHFCQKDWSEISNWFELTSPLEKKGENIEREKNETDKNHSMTVQFKNLMCYLEEPVINAHELILFFRI